MSITNEYCRLCLTSNNLVPIFGNVKDLTLAEKISQLCSVDIKFTDNRLSKQVCTKCFDRIENWGRFLETCSKTQQIIKGEDTEEILNTSIELKEEPGFMDDSFTVAETDEPTIDVQTTICSKSTNEISVYSDVLQNYSSIHSLTGNVSLSYPQRELKVPYKLPEVSPVRKTHIRSNYGCNNCNRAFTTQNGVNAHQGWHKRQKHNVPLKKKRKKTDELQRQQSNAYSEEFKCLHCHKAFSKKRSLANHSRIHVMGLILKQ